MKLATIIHMAWLCLALHTPTQDNLLHQKVNLSYQEASIVEVLQHIQQEYDIRFSYLNNEIPEDVKVNINMQDQPLYLALDKILEETTLSYQVVSGQVILKKDVQKAKKESKPKPALGEGKPDRERSSSAIKPEPAKKVKSDTLAQQATDETATVSISKSQQSVSRLPSEKVKINVEEKDELTEKIMPAPAAEENKRPVIPTNKKEEKTKLGEKFKHVGLGLRKLFQRMPGEDKDDYERRSFHLGIIYPLSTNGTDAGKYVNEFSLHWLVGYAAGLDGVEFSGFGNIENDFVKGVQFAGFFNVVKNNVNGGQFAGFLNVNGGNLEGAQFAGFINTAVGEVDGVQGAGFINMATGYTNGAQFAGFMNVITDDAEGIQGAGFANFASGNIAGAQLAGFINYSHDVNVQLSGFMNVASGDVKGLQGAGFINIARNVRGAQLGVFNVADSVDGVPVGFLSIVRKNGYRKLEVWGGETLHTNVGFKIGVEKFYNIFAFGSQFAAENFRWGFGYGAGTQIGLTSRDYLNIDLMSFQIQEDGDRIFEETELNLLNTLRIAYTHQFSEHFSLFVAPTFNVMVSQRQNGVDGNIGTDIAPWTVFDKTYTDTNVQMWPGFHLGLRF
ncbi:hypothetical protein [Catalinimonas niigatensis]|uniref:hypothetical protein n=1 Tax=Catalinimonas niigatensis TaxID=1397264 RepID=UPI002666ACE7|nr:hypothetical protein [Catalinimonas niigatensis]WPP53106.1 hypothetical protein PZB72_12035 [Catalinimonas niigatensis]